MDILVIILIIVAFLFVALPFIYIVFRSAFDIWTEMVHDIFKGGE